ncbi:efflux RND transporter periplasmic adaptor subunit [Candidatus Kuenenbacteria bacterium]|nr:efflux RND transporter periplasmic adaptor subunit [Candidatus Kuenenbacteria bacterium]
MILKKKSFWIISIIIVVLIGGGIYVSKKPTVVEYDTVVAEKGELIQEVSITGSVKPAEEVELAFERSGKLTYLPFQVGKEIKKGQTVASQSNADIAAQIKQARAGVDSAKAVLQKYEAVLSSEQVKLNEYKLGTRTEEIEIAETTVANAELSLINAKNNLTDVKNNAVSAIDEDYDSALSATASAVSVAENQLYTMTDLQEAHFSEYDNIGNIISDAKSVTVLALLGQDNTGRWTNYALSKLNGGAKNDVAVAQNNPTQSNIELALINMKDSLQKEKNALDKIQIKPAFTATQILNLSTAKTNISAELTSLAAKQQTITVQKTTNINNISTAESAITEAENALASAKSNLSLKQAGYTIEQISTQEAAVKQAEANVNSQKAQIKSSEANVLNYQAQIGKTVLKSPISGIITKVDAKLGEIVSANSTVIKVISKAKYQIEANVPEVDIANIKLSDIAVVTLDAYSSDKEFQATVIKIDPAETIIDNVPTYKVTFQFAEESELIKSGMTADLDILTEKKGSVISVPQRAILKQNGDKIVRILNEDGLEFTEVKVTTGLRGSNGNIEILKGVSVGDEVVISIKNGK